jgi:ribosome-associated translation inhibitor RaiA
MSARANPATVQGCLRVGGGFSQGDQSWIVEQFATLDTRLVTFDAGTTELEVSVKDRAARGQKVTLECWIGGRQKVVTTSSEEDLHDALNDVRDDLRRRLNDAKTRQEPRHNRHLRDNVSQNEPAGGEGGLFVPDASDGEEKPAGQGA